MTIKLNIVGSDQHYCHNVPFKINSHHWNKKKPAPWLIVDMQRWKHFVDEAWKCPMSRTGAVEVPSAVKVLNPTLSSSLQQNKRSGEKEGKKEKRMKRVWSSRRRERLGLSEGQRPKVRALQTRQRGPWDLSEACLCVWGTTVKHPASALYFKGKLSVYVSFTSSPAPTYSHIPPAGSLWEYLLSWVTLTHYHSDRDTEIIGNYTSRRGATTRLIAPATVTDTGYRLLHSDTQRTLFD